MNRRLVKLRTLEPGDKFQYAGRNYMIVIPTHEMKYLTGNAFVWVADLKSGDLVFISGDSAAISYAN